MGRASRPLAGSGDLQRPRRTSRTARRLRPDAVGRARRVLVRPPARAVERFVERGGNVVAMSGNTMFWQVRLEPDHEPTGGADEARRRCKRRGPHRRGLR
ncbi:MAG: DUF6605 domain-containing protein [Ilumatobacteraceae bacterium]